MGRSHDEEHGFRDAASGVAVFLGLQQGVVPLVARLAFDRGQRFALASALPSPWWWISCLVVIAVAFTLVAALHAEDERADDPGDGRGAVDPAPVIDGSMGAGRRERSDHPSGAGAIRPDDGDPHGPADLVGGAVDGRADAGHVPRQRGTEQSGGAAAEGTGDRSPSGAGAYDAASAAVLLIGIYCGVAPFISRLVFDGDLFLALPLRLPAPWWWIVSLGVVLATFLLLVVIDQVKERRFPDEP